MRLGRSSQMCAIGRIIAEVADTDATVLILGLVGGLSLYICLKFLRGVRSEIAASKQKQVEHASA